MWTVPLKLHRLDKALHNLRILVYLLELMLHVGRNLALAGGQTELIPPRICGVDETDFLFVVFQVLFATFLHLLSLECRLPLGRYKQCDILVDGKQHGIQETVGNHFLQQVKHLRDIIVLHLVATLIVIGKGEKALLLYEHRFHINVAQLVMLQHGLAQRHLHEGASFGGFGHAVQEFFNVFGHR